MHTAKLRNFNIYNYFVAIKNFCSDREIFLAKSVELKFAFLTHRSYLKLAIYLSLDFFHLSKSAKVFSLIFFYLVYFESCYTLLAQFTSNCRAVALNITGVQNEEPIVYICT